MQLYVDTETTGLLRIRSGVRDTPRMVEVAGVLVDATGAIIGQVDAMVRPVGYAIPLAATRIHGITTEIALRCGADVRAVLALLGELTRVADVVVGHNVEFDIAVIGAECRRIGVRDRLAEKPRYCTMKGATEIVGERDGRGRRKWPTLGETYRALFGEELPGAHRAMNDARACRRCHEELMRRAVQRTEQLRLAGFCDAERTPLDAIRE